MSKPVVSGKRARRAEPAKNLADAARASVGERLANFREQLDSVSRAGASPSDHDVHQVRVSTRRAGSALAAFDGCFRRRRVKKLKRRLRSARNAAGAVRRCDVLMKLFGERRASAAHEEAAALDCVAAGLHAMRDEALLGIARACRKKARAKLELAAARLLEAVHAPGRGHDSDEPMTTAALARVVIPRLVGVLRNDADRDLAVFEHLHNLRLDAKRLRYALEVFEPCFDAEPHRTLYRCVVSVQDELGEINDLHDAMAWLEHVWENAGAEILPMPSETGEGITPDALRKGLASLAAGYRAERDGCRAMFVRGWLRSRSVELFSALDAMLVVPGDSASAEQPEIEIVSRLAATPADPARTDRGFITQGA